ncbi:MAG: hypothetical protein ACLF0G_03005 [Candidatus Brocadiia bacterium]
MITFRCSCGREFEARDEAAGRHMRCPECGERVQVPQPQDSPEPTDEGEAGPCPECQAPLAPGAVLCTNCGYDLRTGQRLETAAEAEPPQEAEAEEPAEEPEEQAEEEEPEPLRPGRAVARLVLSLVVLGAVAAGVYWGHLAIKEKLQGGAGPEDQVPGIGTFRQATTADVIAVAQWPGPGAERSNRTGNYLLLHFKKAGTSFEVDASKLSLRLDDGTACRLEAASFTGGGLFYALRSEGEEHAHTEEPAGVAHTTTSRPGYLSLTSEGSPEKVETVLAFRCPSKPARTATLRYGEQEPIEIALPRHF